MFLIAVFLLTHVVINAQKRVKNELGLVDKYTYTNCLSIPGRFKQASFLASNMYFMRQISITFWKPSPPFIYAGRSCGCLKLPVTSKCILLYTLNFFKSLYCYSIPPYFPGVEDASDPAEDRTIFWHGRLCQTDTA